jgi:hypothetical protein
MADGWGNGAKSAALKELSPEVLGESRTLRAFQADSLKRAASKA